MDERFWRRVDKNGPEVRPGLGPCWIWGAFVAPCGYGMFGVTSSDTQLAHRVSYRLSVGPIDDGLFVLHHCDNRRCVNPAHLYAGTALDNSQDMIRRGRARNRRTGPLEENRHG